MLDWKNITFFQELLVDFSNIDFFFARYFFSYARLDTSSLFIITLSIYSEYPTYHEHIDNILFKYPWFIALDYSFSQVFAYNTL